MMNKKILGIVGLVVVLAGVVGYIYWDAKKQKNPENTTVLPGGISMTGDGKVELVSIDDKKLPPMPSLDRVVVPLSTVDAAIVKAVQAQMATTIATLKKDATDADNWNALGIQRKNLGDYIGARDAWEYAKALVPTNYVYSNNLGDLYHYYLKDYARSEQNWKNVIAIAPQYVQGYVGLVDLYTYSLKSKSGDIPTVLKSGISKAPDAVDLQVMLARYYEKAGFAGSIEQAKTAYKEAIATAERLGNSSLVELLKNALAALK